MIWASPRITRFTGGVGTVNELGTSERISSTTSGGKRVLGISVARAGLAGGGPPIRRPWLLMTALLAASFLAACSGGSSQPASQGSSAASSVVGGASPAPVTLPAPASRITPGHGTPQDAVEGYVQAVFQGNWTLACSYASPGTQQACLQGNADFGRESGQLTIHGIEINGDDALVELTGTVCNDLLGCLSSLDPSSGMPPSPSDFSAAYDAALPSTPHSSALSISPLPMIKVNGQWYVNYG